MQFETIYFVERKSKTDLFYGDILEWTISLSRERTLTMKQDLEKFLTDKDETYYIVRSMIITD